MLIAIAGNAEVLVGLGGRLACHEHAFSCGLQIDPFLPHFQANHRLGIAAKTYQRLGLLSNSRAWFFTRPKSIAFHSTFSMTPVMPFG